MYDGRERVQGEYREYRALVIQFVQRMHSAQSGGLALRSRDRDLPRPASFSGCFQERTKQTKLSKTMASYENDQHISTSVAESSLSPPEAMQAADASAAAVRGPVDARVAFARNHAPRDHATPRTRFRCEGRTRRTPARLHMVHRETCRLPMHRQQAAPDR